MIIDIHTHIFPSCIKNDRASFFTNESAFKLLYASEKSKIVDGNDLILAMDENGVDLSVTFGFPWKNMETCRLHNDYIIEQTKKFPNRLKGFCCVDIFHPSALEEVERCLNAGMSGVGELALYEEGITEGAIEKMAPIFALCAQRDLPIMIHVNEPVGHLYPGKAPIQLDQIYHLVKRFPKNKIILAHWGGGIFFYTLLKKEVKEALKNVFFDTAASPYLYDKEIYQTACQFHPPENFLFGSDYPLLKPTRYFKEMKDSGLSSNLAEKICGKNAELFFQNESIVD